MPGLPPVVVDVGPGMSLDEAEAWACAEAGLLLIHPPAALIYRGVPGLGWPHIPAVA